MKAMAGWVKRMVPVLLALVAVLSGLPGMRAVAADDMPAPAQALLELLRVELQLDPQVEAVRLENGDIVLDNVLFGEMRQDGQTVLTGRAREIRLSGARLADGLVHYRRIRVIDVSIRFASHEGQPGEIRIPLMAFERASLLPRDNAANPVEKLAASQLMAEFMEIPDIVFSLPGVPQFHWRGLEASWRGDRRTGAGEVQADFGLLQVPLLDIARLDRANATEMVRQLRMLGLETLSFGGMLSSTSRWTADQRLMMDADLRLGVREAGELRLVLGQLALPLALLQQGSDIRRKLGRKGMDGMRQAPGGQMPGQEFLGDPQMAAAIRQLAIGELTVAWRDFGLTRRLIAQAARTAGASEEAYIAALLQQLQPQLAAMLPATLAQAITRELSRYLVNPASLRISLRGAGGQPVSVPGLMMFMVAPQMLFNALHIEVQANAD